jgi:hypothetical protein
LDLALQVATAENPSDIVLLGDMLDLEGLSKYLSPPDSANLVQAAICELHGWLSDLRAACPSAKITYLEGNHEARLAKTVMAQISEAYGLRRADKMSEGPVLSVPYLLGLEGLGIEYIGPYGADYWLWNTVQILHGEVVRQGGGSTVAGLLRAHDHCVIQGHIHRLEQASRTVASPTGPHTYWACSPGTLARIDGAVPGASRPDWQQGLALVRDLDSGPALELAQIQAGEVFVGGRGYLARSGYVAACEARLQKALGGRA